MPFFTEKSDKTLVGVLSFFVVVVVVLLVVAIVSTVLAIVFYRRQKYKNSSRSDTHPDTRGTENKYEPCNPGRTESDGNDEKYKAVAEDTEGTTNPQKLSCSSPPPESNIVEDTIRESSLAAMEEDQSVPTPSTDIAGSHSLNEGSDEIPRRESMDYDSKQKDKAMETETYPSSPELAKSGHIATPTDSPLASPKQRKMSFTQRLSKRSSISLEEAQVLLHGEDSRTAKASSTNTVGDVTDGTSQPESVRYDSKEETLSPSKKKSSLTRRGSAFKRSSIKSTDSTSEAEKPRSKLAFAYKPMPNDDSETEMQ